MIAAKSLTRIPWVSSILQLVENLPKLFGLPSITPLKVSAMPAHTNHHLKLNERQAFHSFAHLLLSTEAMQVDAYSASTACYGLMERTGG